ncbi:MAG: amino acid aminotransferase [Sphingomonadales bacterium]
MAEGFLLADEKMLFERLPEQQPDSLLALIGLFRDDPRPTKIDVGVGVYRDAAGTTPILRCVKAAERILLDTQETKGYLGPDGDTRFAELTRQITLGEALAGDRRIVGMQTPGGCGALRLGADLVKHAGASRIFVGQPTWPNHDPLLAGVGLETVDYHYYDKSSHTLQFDRMMSALQDARAGDLVLLHGCCHNPTGADLSLDQWDELSRFVVERGLIPFIDLAYQGLGNGLEADAAGTRLMVSRVEQAVVAQSCDKNFGLYRDRTGTLFVKAASEATAQKAYGNMMALSRTNWSMPPDHGAAVVRTVLDTPALAAEWYAELDEMLARIRHLRARIALADPSLAYIDRQNGMFSMLPLSPEAVLELRKDEGIYMASSGRFNVAGLSDENVDRFSAAVAAKIAQTRKAA